MFNPGDKVKVQYSFRKFYTGTVLWTQQFSGLEWVTVKPDDPMYINTFGSSRDMGAGYKSYIANDPIVGNVFPL